MTPLKTYLQNVQARLENATPGKWEFTFQEPEGFPCCYIDKEKTKDVTIADLNLIDQAPTDLSTLLQIVKIQSQALEFYGAGENIYQNGPILGEGKFGPPLGTRARQAIQQVETLVSGGKNDCV